MLKHKKILILVAVIGTAVLVAGGFRIYAQRGSFTYQSSTELSSRAKTFIADDRADGAGLWSEVQVLASDEQTELIPPGNITNECFSAFLPWESYNHQLEREADRCTWRVKVFNPMALVVISVYLQPDPINDASITLRQRQNEKYQLRSEELSSYPSASWYYDTESETLFLPANGLMMTVSYTPAIPTTEPPISLLKELVGTLKPVLLAEDNGTINE